MASVGLPVPLSAEAPQNITFLTPEEQNRIPDDIKEKILHAVQDLNRRFHSAVATREADKTISDTRIGELESEIASHVSKVAALKTQLSEESKMTEMYIEKFKNAITSSNELDAKIRQCQIEAHESKIKCDQAVAEKEDLSSIVEKRNSEIEKLKKDINQLAEDLQSATIAKINALTKVDELVSKEMELDYKEKQLKKESEWVEKQVQLLNEELDRKNANLITQQQESSLKYMGLQVELTEKSEQVRIAEMSLDNVKRINEEQEKHIERLLEKLKDAQEVEAKLVENYRQELKSQKKIADLYKESSEEASKKVGELEDAVANLQELLQHATERYGDLETRSVNAGKSFQEEVTVRDEKIESLNKELADANELLNSVKKHGMTEEMIHSLSPAAAAASSMLKNTHSLTEIYSRYQSLHSELEIAKMENQKLNNYINEIVKDIEERTPGIRQQREDYENAVKTVDILNGQLELAMEENGKSKTEIAVLKKSVGSLDRENERLKLQLADLATQVKTLLKEIEVNRGNYHFEEPREVPDISANSSQVIANRLVTFRNIEELQMQNQQLLAVVRELSESQESAEKRISENQMQQIKEAFEAAKAEMEELRGVRMRQDKMMEQVVKQRDTYSSLLKQSKPLDKDKSANQADVADLEKKLTQAQFSLTSLKEEYDTYRKEKATNDRMTDETLEKLRDEIAKMRVENGKLGSQAEYNNERAKIYNANLQTFKQNIAVLEEKNKQYGMTVFKFEQSVNALKTELHSTQQKLAQAEVSLSSMTQERNSLRDAKSRLLAERDLFQREKSTQQRLQTNLEEIKNSLGMANNSIKMRLENQIDTLQQECNMLRQKVDTENDRFKDAVLSWDTTNKALRDKLISDQAVLAATKSELETCKNQIERQNSEIEQLTSQVNALSNFGAGAPSTPTSTSSPQAAVHLLNPKIFTLEKKTKELNLQLIDAQTEIRSLRQQLDISKASVEEYKNLCGSMEEQLKSSSNNSSAFHDELNERLACKDDIIRDVQSRLDTIEKENHSLKEERSKISNEFQGKTTILEEEIGRMRRELQSANLKLQGVIEENCNIKNDLERNVQISKDLQQKWESEQANHANEVKTNAELQSKVENLQAKLHDEEILRMKADTVLREARLSFEMRENSLNENVETMKKNVNELETLNVNLQNQLINLTTQTNSLQQTGVGQPSSSTSVGETSTEGDPKNSEQWLQLIKYLRREKEIANAKTEMAVNSSHRLEGQLQYAEKQCEELRRQLNDIQERSQVTVITSVKQAELLRKVETLSALTDSNRMLREEKDNALKEITDLKTKLEQIEAELGPLRQSNADLDSKCETLSSENTALKQDVARWRARASALLEKSNKVNPEELKRLQTDNDNLQKHLQSLQDTVKKQQQEITRQAQQIRMIQQQSSVLQTSNQALQQEKKTLQDENKRLMDENSQHKAESAGEIENARTTLAEKDAAVKKLTAELKKSQAQTEDQKNTVKQVKNIARKYKKQFEDLKAEQETGATNSEQNSSTGMPETNVATAGTTTEDLASSQEEASTREARIAELTQENDRLKQEVENSKGDSNQKQEQTKLAMKNLRDKLTLLTQQKDEVQTLLDEAKAKVTNMEVSTEENNVRFAALKSQYEGRLSRLEKENKELKASSASSTPVPGTSDMAALNNTLQQDNERLKKELDMLRQRLLAIEKQFKLQSQQHSSKGAAPSGDKTQSDPPKANIKPIAGTSSSTIQKPATPIVPTAISRPPLTASIRPMSMQIRKATVMPTTATATAMPTQQSSQSQQQPSSLSVQPLSNFVAPVSQAQVSTSTPDQSSATETATQHLPVTSSASTPISASSTNVRQAAVQPTLTVTVAPIPTAVASVVPPQSGQDNESASGLREDPSTSSSHVMDSEMGDSSEQVSSSESSSTHQPMLTVAPIRSQQQDHVQQSDQAGPSQTTGNQSIPGLEEPSPSTSTSAPRPSQSGKRARDSEVETSQESQNSDEPESKRSRAMPMPIDREAEAMSHQQEQPHQQSDPNEVIAQEQEADQGRNEDENQMPHSDTSENKPGGSAQRGGMQDDDDDSDVIVIDSDDDELAPSTPSVQRRHITNRQRQEIEDDDEDEVDEEEDIEDDDDLGDDEDIEEEEDVDEDDDQDEDEDPDDEGLDHEDVHEDDDDDVGIEDREAESLEHEGESQEADNMSMEQDADILDEAEYDSNGGIQGEDEERHDEVESAGTAEAGGSPYRRQTYGDASGSSTPSASVRDSSPGTSSDVVRSAGSQLRSLQQRSGRQDRLASFGRQSLTPSSFHPQPMYADESEDSIVPSTPTLFVPRRDRDGFAEAVSSPQIPNQPRFTFSAPSDTTTPTGSSEIEDTRVDLLQYDDSTGRSVPTTPLQVSPPDVADLSSELDSHVNDLHESIGVSQEIMDIQPSSSDTSRSASNMEVPTITVTSAQVDSAVDQEAEDSANLDAEVSEVTDVQIHSIPIRTEASVTSSDEDKLDMSSSGGQLQPSTSSSSRAASPTPSSAPQTPHDQPIPQQHRVRPTPIIWDQPTSSSSVPPTSRLPRGRGGLLRQMQAPPEQGMNMSLSRGTFRQLRGAQQSARRSRPHSRGIIRGTPFNKPY